MKALFIWADGYVDYAEVLYPLRPLWKRHRMEKERTQQAIQNNVDNLLGRDTHRKFDTDTLETSTFALERFSDGSFQYRENAVHDRGPSKRVTPLHANPKGLDQT